MKGLQWKALVWKHAGEFLYYMQKLSSVGRICIIFPWIKRIIIAHMAFFREEILFR